MWSCLVVGCDILKNALISAVRCRLLSLNSCAAWRITGSIFITLAIFQPDTPERVWARAVGGPARGRANKKISIFACLCVPIFRWIFDSNKWDIQQHSQQNSSVYPNPACQHHTRMLWSSMTKAEAEITIVRYLHGRPGSNPRPSGQRFTTRPYGFYYYRINTKLRAWTWVCVFRKDTKLRAPPTRLIQKRIWPSKRQNYDANLTPFESSVSALSNGVKFAS